MKWVKKAPRYADMIRVRVGALWHYGIYVSDEEIIQFGLAPSRRWRTPDSEIEVLASDLSTFSGGGEIEVCEADNEEKMQRRSPEEVVACARGSLGTRGYDFFTNNCEHFANECVFGKRVSEQADRAVEIFRSLPKIDVYYAKIPDKEIGAPLRSEERNKEIARARNERAKREKYYAWRLLEYAAGRSFEIEPEQLAPYKAESGKWRSDKIEFSISHSDGAVAVAVAEVPVGVDIEPADARHSERLAKRTMTEEELALYYACPESERAIEFIGAWCAKEAIFKAQNEVALVPKSIDTLHSPCSRRTIEIDGRKFVCAVSASYTDRARFFNIDNFY